MEDIVKLHTAVDAAMEALGTVILTTRKVGDDETDLGLGIDTLGQKADAPSAHDAHGRYREGLRSARV
jgi:hypothetical protein